MRSRSLVLVLALLAAAPAAAQTSADDGPAAAVRDAQTAEMIYRLGHLFDPPRQSITIPNTFVNGTVANATQVNANFTALASNALNRNGGTMLGTLNSRAVTPTSDATYDFGTNLLRFRDGWFSRNGSFGGTLAVTGAVTFTVPLPATGGGTGLASGTSGGVLYFSSGTTIASSAALTTNDLVIGAGAGAAPTTLGTQTANKFLAGPATGSAAIVTARVLDPQDLESTCANVTSQFDKTTNTTLADVTPLSFTLVAGKVYHFRATLYTTLDAAGGFKVGTGGTATATAFRASAWGLANAVSPQGGQAAAIGSIATGNPATSVTLFVNGTITVNAGGTLTIQFAQASAVGTSSVLTGSEYCVY